MAHPDLPKSVKAFTAKPTMRWRHRYWHLVKNPEFVNDPARSRVVQGLAKIGWTAALTGEPGAGLDFLFMHRMMIKNIDVELAAANDPAWPKVIGWNSIPVDPDDPHWPEPPIENLDDPSSWPENQRRAIAAISEARTDQSTKENIEFSGELRNPAVLKQANISLDRYGHAIEVTVHNWMHTRYSAAPPKNGEDISPSNDWLGDAFSSHVNPYFWKLHGWIEDCIGVWEEAFEKTADFSTAWRPPADAPPIDELDIGVALTEEKNKSALIAGFTSFQAPHDVVQAARNSLSN